MPALGQAIQTLNSRLAVVTANLKKFPPVPKMNATQKFQCGLLLQERDRMLNQIKAFSQAEANLKRVAPAAPQPLKAPVLNARPNLSGDDMRDLMRLDRVRAGVAAIPSVQAHDEALLARFNALQPGSCPLPVQAYAYRTDTQKRELLNRELFLTTPVSKVFSAEGTLYNATLKYINTGMVVSSSDEISKAYDQKSITFEQYMSLRSKFNQNIVLINAKLRIMSAFENTDMAQRRSAVEETFKMVNEALKHNPTQKIAVITSLKSWINEPKSALHAPALKPLKSFKPAV